MLWGGIEAAERRSMFQFIFDLISEPLGLPMEWYYEWIILAAIEGIAYRVAYDKVGSLYRGKHISGSVLGSLVHWLIRTVYFVFMWAVIYAVIWILKFIRAHIAEITIGLGIAVICVIIIKIAIWNNRRNKLNRNKVQE